jgi:membrane fusion protein, multidrug efflux system
MNRFMLPLLLVIVAGLRCGSGMAQTHELVQVVSKPVSKIVELPGEIQPYLNVTLHSRVPGFVEKVLVDRGSIVREGDLLVELSAPDVEAQIAESQSKVEAAAADVLQAEAQLAAAESTLQRLNEAAKTPGAIAGNEVVVAEKQVDANKALVQSRQQSRRAAEGAVNALKAMESYLRIVAPFDGIVTERLIHPGALVGPNTNSPLMVIQQVSKLRLVVSVPEEDVAGIARGSQLTFRVPAFPGRMFSGTVARVPRSLDPKTRSMAVEADVINKDQLLAPGMYPSVNWPVRNLQQSLFVPKTSVVTTTERTFVIRARNGRAEWVDVRKGSTDGDWVQVFGAIQSGDRVVKQATDELREGMILRSTK